MEKENHIKAILMILICSTIMHTTGYDMIRQGSTV